jgi:hypothetical protein
MNSHMNGVGALGLDGKRARTAYTKAPDTRTGEGVPLQPLPDTSTPHRDRPHAVPHRAPDQDLVPEPAHEVEEGKPTAEQQVRRESTSSDRRRRLPRHPTLEDEDDEDDNDSLGGACDDVEGATVLSSPISRGNDDDDGGDVAKGQSDSGIAGATDGGCRFAGVKGCGGNGHLQRWTRRSSYISPPAVGRRKYLSYGIDLRLYRISGTEKMPK